MTLRHVLLGAALAYFLLIGGADAGLIWWPFRAINAALAGSVIGIWLWRGLRHADMTDKLALAALLVFLASCVASVFPRMSLDAGVSAIAYAAAFGIARGELADATARRAIIATLAMCGVVMAIFFAVAWGNVWLAWLNIAGSVPPLDLRLPAGPYRHYYVVAMQLLMLIPAMFAVVRRRWVGPAALAGLVISLLLIVMAGSRSVWGAGVVAAAVALGYAVHWSPRRAALAVAGVVVMAAVFVASGLPGPFISRLTTESTVSGRFEIWAASLQLWAERPLLGWGPGTFPPALTLTDLFSRLEAVGRHAHNASIQLLAEAGLAGMMTLGLLVAALVIGIRHASGPYHRLALFGLGLFGWISLTDNPSDLPHLVVTAIAWAALAAPRRVQDVAPAPIPSSSRVALTLIAPVFALAVVTSLVAGYAFDVAREHALGRDPSQAVRALDVAVALDPGNAQYRRERGLWRAASGDLAGALDDLSAALDLDRADITAYRSLAALGLRANPIAAVGHAQAAVELHELDPANAIMLAHVAYESRQPRLAVEALTQAVRVAPWIIGSPSWDEWFGDAPVEGIAERALVALEVGGEVNPRFAQQVAWLRVMTGRPADPATSESISALDAVLRCQPGADEAIGGLPPDDVVAPAAIIQARLRHDEVTAQRVIALAQLRLLRVARLAAEDVAPMSPFVDRVEDSRIYHQPGLPPPELGPLLPTSDEALSAWLREPVETAQRTGLSIPLAGCDP